MLMGWFTSGVIEYSDLYGAGPPFEMNEYVYIEYALADFDAACASRDEVGRMRHLINCVGNTKRALDCRVDTFIEQWGLSEIVKKKNRIKDVDGNGVPGGIAAKMQALQNANILAPTVLRTIRDYRNNIEHDYDQPDINQVEEYLDIVRLFLASSRQAARASIAATSFSEQRLRAHQLPSREVGEPAYPVSAYYVQLYLDSDKSLINLEYAMQHTEKMGTVSIFAERDLEKYFYVLRGWYRMLEFY